MIATVHVPFVRGGAEILAEDLCQAIEARGHEAEIVAVPCPAWPSEGIFKHLLLCRLLDMKESCGRPIDRLIGLKYPAYLIRHPNKILWLIHQHRQAYDLWDDRFGLSQVSAGPQIRDVIRQTDRLALRESRAVYTISKNVSRRLEECGGEGATPLYPPPRNAERYHCGSPDGYLFFPSRIAPLKRHGLVLEALARTRQPVRLRLAGFGCGDGSSGSDAGDALKRRAEELGVTERIEWLGELTEEELAQSYAHAIGVVFPPCDEDYGYVTLEAMLASKPVITCSDSGGPLEFVRPRETGLIAEPTPGSVATSLDDLWENPERSRRWGEAGRRRYEKLQIGWSRILDRLLA